MMGIFDLSIILCQWSIAILITESSLSSSSLLLKGDEPLSFHLACDFGCDPNGTCYYQPEKYISILLSTYEHIFPGELLKKQSSTILKGDHPELDDSEFISEEDKAKYMSMIRTAQWLVTLGRIDITINASTLSSYREAP